MVFLGILLEGVSMSLSISNEKRLRALSMINSMLDRKKAQVWELEKLCGFCNFLNKAVFPGRAFTRRMYCKFSEIIGLSKNHEHKLKQHHHLSLDQEFKRNCRVWKLFLTSGSKFVVNRPMVDFSKTVTADQIDFYSDASAAKNLGFGCVFGKRWIFAQWEPDFVDMYKPSIEFLELFALCAGLLTWEKHLTNCRIIVFCDNQSVVDMMNNFTASCSQCMQLIRIITLNGLLFNRRVFVRHVRGFLNRRADALSRLKLDKFRQVAPYMNVYPDKISDKVWPLLWLMEQELGMTC